MKNCVHETFGNTIYMMTYTCRNIRIYLSNHAKNRTMATVTFLRRSDFFTSDSALKAVYAGSCSDWTSSSRIPAKRCSSSIVAHITLSRIVDMSPTASMYAAFRSSSSSSDPAHGDRVMRFMIFKIQLHKAVLNYLTKSGPIKRDATNFKPAYWIIIRKWRIYLLVDESGATWSHG